MVKKKEIDVKIKIAVISGIFLVAAYGISAYLQSPLADTQYQERPIIGVSFKDWTNYKYPKELLEYDGTNYFIYILADNKGNSKGKIFVTVTSTNAKVSFFKNEEYSYQVSLHYSVKPIANFTILTPPIFIKPEQNSTFSVKVSIKNSLGQNPFQEFDPFIPLSLTYEYTDEGFKIIDRK